MHATAHAAYRDKAADADAATEGADDMVRNRRGTVQERVTALKTASALQARAAAYAPNQAAADSHLAAVERLNADADAVAANL